MVNYKDLGLVNTKEMFKGAVDSGYNKPAQGKHGPEKKLIHGCRSKSNTDSK